MHDFMNRFVSIRKWLGILCLSYAPNLPTASAADPATVLILDASASMRTGLETGTRLDAAKIAVGNVISDAMEEDPGQRFGFIAFYDGCWVDVMFRPQRLKDQYGDMLRRVQNLSTREFGHTPIARSLEIAGQMLDDDGGQVVLVSDGQESCEEHRDLCGLAAQLESRNVEFAIHLVGLALNPDQEEALRCIPEITGGTFLSVHSAADLVTAVDQATTGDISQHCYDNRGGLWRAWCAED